MQSDFRNLTQILGLALVLFMSLFYSSSLESDRVEVA